MKTVNSIATVVAPAQGKPLNILGHSVTVKIARKETEGNYYVMEVVTPAGHGIPPHVHDREDEFIYVLEGEFEVMLGGKLFMAPKGAQIFFPRHIPHAFTNVGTTAGKTLWTIIPGGNFEDFFEELNALPAGPPDMGEVVRIFGKYGMEVLIGQEA
jgi:quercetin dioxygenase-like cupin family protein